MDPNYKRIRSDLQQIIDDYNGVMNNAENEAQNAESYGGSLRGKKGPFVEDLSKNLVLASWVSINGDPARCSVEPQKKRIRIPIKESYIDSIQSEEIRIIIRENIQRYYYSISADVHVFIDDTFVLSIECKNYTENAMLKRVLVDCTLLKTVYPDLAFLLLQLESSLGGDIIELKEATTQAFFSKHTLLSLFEIDLKIVTLLQGRRSSEKPIHKKEFFKPLTIESLESAVSVISSMLVGYL